VTRPLAAGFAALAAATWLLIVVGALVRANGAGLACPDWPLCFGELVPRFDVKVAFEWGHRALAGAISLGLAALSLVARNVPGMRARLALLWLLLGTQVVFGGLTVLLQLAPWTVTVHLLLGNTFCAALLWTAADLREAGRQTQRGPLSHAVRALASATLILIAVQVALGGLVSSHAAGLACATFPTCDGRSFVPTLHGQVGIHVLHRATAFALLGAIGWLVWAARHEPRLGALARGSARLVLLQIVLGVINVLLRLPPEITALHSALAAVLVLHSALMLREVVLARAEVRLVNRTAEAR
jgi:cytochrome c oxidase assembly protein subunit 15